MSLPDVQNSPSSICIALNRVGITSLQLPISIVQMVGGFQHTVAMIDCFVDLDADKKGINMSRIPVALHKYIDQPINLNVLTDIAENIRVTSEAQLCELSFKFPYFIKKFSPVNREPGFVPYDIIFNVIKTNGPSQFMFEVGVTATSLCPCSKELSDNSAHNQKCLIRIKCWPVGWIWLEDIIRVAETSASGEIYSVLKRPDEKYVTDLMYANPAFVEDIARSVYMKLLEWHSISHFEVIVESDESIHKHRAVAIIDTYLKSEV
jgi:GTP cyclohydrolase IB